MPKGISKIEEETFAYCNGIKGSLNIPSNISDIESQAFYGCTSFSGTLVIPSSVKQIGTNAFYECTGFSSLIINDGAGSIGNGAFMNCSGITGSLTIPGSCKEIGDHAFTNCGFDGKLTIMDGVENIGAFAFGNRTTYDSVDMLYSALEFTGSLTIPRSVKNIGDHAFCGCSFDGTLTLNEGIVSIGKYAFSDCDFVGDLIIPDSVEILGEGAFYNCDKFTGYLIVGNSVNGIEKITFANCFGLIGSLIIPDSVKTIGEFAFVNTGFTGTLTLGNSLTSIGESAFGNTSDSSVIAGNAAEFTGSLVIPHTVECIGDMAFAGCNFDGTLTLSNSLTSIGRWAFASNYFTGTLEIPDSINSIGVGAFSNCAFEKIIIPSGVNFVGDTFSFCHKLNSVELENGISLISEEMFAFCRALREITVPNSVVNVEPKAFYSSGLENIYFLGDAPVIDSTSFDNTSDNLTIHYMSDATGWTDSEAYDAVNGTWNGYKLQVINQTTPDAPAINYTCFGKLDDCTYKYITDTSTGLGKYIAETITIDGVTYTASETSGMQYIVFPEDGYLKEYYYVAYNLDESGVIINAAFLPGVECTLEGYDAATNIVDTDYTPIIPVGEDRTLPSGSFYVSDITESSFPSDQIGSWVGDRVRIYTVGEEIYKVVHITNGYGQLTRTDLTASPMIAEIDGVDYPVVAGDAGLAETIRAFPPGSQVSYTLYDGVIVEMASAEIPTLRVSINNPGNTYYVGEYICVLASDCLDTPSGTVRSMPINPVVSVSDEAILSLENTITSLPDIFSILGLGKGIGLEDDTFVCYTFRANAPGNVAIHIGDDSTNGRQLTIPIAISVDPHAGMRADDVEIYEWDLLGSEDYYNEIVNGMVISDFNCTRRDDGDSEYRFNVYNRSTLLGVAEVYDAAGNLIDIRIIDKASMPTDLKSTLAETWNGLIKPIVTDQDLFSFRGSGSKRTDFTSNPILVPEGGHVKITNSMAISVPCLLLNSMDITLEGIGFLKGSVDVAEFTSASAKQTLLRQVLKTYLTPEGQQDILSQIAKSSLSSAGQAEIVAMFTDISGFAAEICDIVLASSHNTVVNTTIGMVQNTLESSGYGSALKVAFAATGIGNLIIQINQFSDSLSSDRAMTVYTPNDRQATVLAASHSVQLQAASVMGADTVLCADMIAASDWSKPHTADSQSCLCYDLSLQTAGCEISLPSASTVTFPLPSGTWEDLRLYYLNPDTKRWEELSYTIEGAQIMAEVNSLGQFALVDGALLDDLPPDTRKYTIKFDANGGYCATKSIELKSAGTLPYFPTAYRSGNWKFVGWYNKPSGGLPYTEDTIFAANPTLYAHWMKTDSPEASNLHISTSIYADEKVGAQITNRTEAPLNGIFVAAVYDESGKMLGIKYIENVLQSQKTLVLTIDAVNTDTIYMLRVFVMDPQSYQPIYPTWETKFPDDEKLV